MQRTPAPLMTSRHFSKCFEFCSGSLPRTRISIGTFPPLRGSRCLAGMFQVSSSATRSSRQRHGPFFEVVTMYRDSNVKTMRVAGNSYPSSQNCRYLYELLTSKGYSEVTHTCMALFFWNDWLSSLLPNTITMDPTPPNNASVDCRLSPFHVETKWDSRLLKASLSILTSSPILSKGSGRAVVGRRQGKINGVSNEGRYVSERCEIGTAKRVNWLQAPMSLAQC